MKDPKTQSWKYFKEITRQDQFVFGKYYAILDNSTLKQVDCFLCNNIDCASKKLYFYRGKCLIVENLTAKEIENALDDLRYQNNAAYWQFVRAAHSKSAAPLMQCVEFQRERSALQKWLNSKQTQN